MKIALVLTKFNPARGGLEYWAWEYSRWLVRRGHDVHVLACRFDERIAAEGEIRHTVPDRASRVERADAFAAALDRLGPDVIHDMGAGWRYDILHPQGDSAVAVWHNNFRFLPLPLRVWKRLSRSQRQRYRDIAALERKQYVESDGLIVAVSDLVRRNIATCFGVAPERFVVIPNGADTERFSPQRRVALREQARQAFGVEKKVVCLAVAHNFDLKGVATAVRAIRRLARQGVPVHLLVAGNGPVEKYRRMTTRLGVAASITFLGFLDDSLRAYAAADIFVHPTWQDACSLVAIEAWACGLPVVTTPLNGAAELMTPGCEGLLLRQPGSARELAEHIRTLMDPAVRERMTGPARMLACRHNLAINFAAVEAVYERVLRRRHMKESGMSELRILEIGDYCMFKGVMPANTTLIRTSGRGSAAAAAGRPFGMRTLFFLWDALRRGRYDLIVCYPAAQPLWAARSGAVRALWRWLATAVRQPAAFGLQSLRVPTITPIAALDYADSPLIGRQNFFLLDRCRVYFKRELPGDHSKTFLGAVPEFSVSPGIWRSPFVLRNLGKLRPISVGIPDATLCALPHGSMEKTVDVFFAGKTDRSTIRRDGLERLRASGVRVDLAEPGLPIEEYLARCARAWLTWSPEGFGWDCFRHYEAPVAGSVPLISRGGAERYCPLEEGVHAFYYDVEGDGLVRAVAGALGDRERLKRMAQVGRAYVLRHFTHRALCDYVLRCCGMAAGGGGEGVDV